MALDPKIVKARCLLTRAIPRYAYAMSNAKPPAPATTPVDARAARLAEQLRANLRKRKAQARAVADGSKPQ